MDTTMTPTQGERRARMIERINVPMGWHLHRSRP